MERNPSSAPQSELPDPVLYAPTQAMHHGCFTSQGKFPGRYLVEKKNYLFSPSKLILALTNDDLSLYSPARSSYPLLQSTQHQQRAEVTIDFRQIESITLSHTEQSFNIVTFQNQQYTINCSTGGGAKGREELNMLVSDICLRKEIQREKVMKVSEKNENEFGIELMIDIYDKETFTMASATVKEYYIQLRLQGFRYVILFFEIKCIKVVDNVMYIVQQNDQVDKMIFTSTQHAQAFITEMNLMAKSNLYLDLNYIQDQDIFNESLFLKAYVFNLSSEIEPLFKVRCQYQRQYDQKYIEVVTQITSDSVFFQQKTDKGLVTRGKIFIASIKYIIKLTEESILVLYANKGLYWNEALFKLQDQDQFISTILGLQDQCIRLLCICPDISARFGCQSSGQTLDLEMATNLLSNAVDAYSICRPLAPSSIDEYILNSDQISIPKPDKHVLAKFTSMINQDIEKFQKLVQQKESKNHTEQEETEKQQTLNRMSDSNSYYSCSSEEEDHQEEPYGKFEENACSICDEINDMSKYLSVGLWLLREIIKTTSYVQDIATENPALIKNVISLLTSQSSLLSYMSLKLLASLITQVKKLDPPSSLQSRILSTNMQLLSKLNIFDNLASILNSNTNDHLKLYSLSTLLLSGIKIKNDRVLDFLKSQLCLIEERSRDGSIDVAIMYSKLLCEFLEFSSTFDYYQQVQRELTENTVQIIYRVETIFNSKFQQQIETSIKILERILFMNKNGVSLFLRLFKKGLIASFDKDQSLLQRSVWTIDQFSAFFQALRDQTVDTLTVQWNSLMRSQLLNQLQTQLQTYEAAQFLHSQSISQLRHDILLPTTKYSFDKNGHHMIEQVSSKPRFNHSEFEVEYQYGIKIYKYYLERLIDENTETKIVEFSTDIPKKEVKRFWEELFVELVKPVRFENKIKIIQTLVLLYTKNTEEIMELKLLPKIIRLFQDQRFKNQHFYILQLILFAVTVSGRQNLKNKNISYFTQFEGIKVLFTVIKTNLKQLFKHSRQDLDISLLILDIVDQVLSNSEPQTCYPNPLSRLSLGEHLNILTFLLISGNQDLSKSVIMLMNKHLCTQFSLQNILNNGIVEFLMLHLDTLYADEALQILMKIQEMTFDYNEQGQFQGLLDEYQTLLQPYQDSFVKDIKQSVFLRYIPIPLILILCQDSQKFLQIYKSDEYETATLIWSSEMRDHLKSQIINNSNSQIRNLTNYNYPLSQLPYYNGPIKEQIQYQNIKDEVRCGQYYLRVWIQQYNEEQSLNSKAIIKQTSETEFTINLKYGLQTIISLRSIENFQLEIILQACLISIKEFSQKQIPFIQEVLTISEVLTDRESEKQNILLAVKILHLLSDEKQKMNQDNQDKILQILFKTCQYIVNQNSSQLNSNEKQCVALDQIDGQIIQFSIKAITQLFQVDMKHYSKLHDQSKAKFIRTLSEILKVSNQLVSTFFDNQLTNQYPAERTPSPKKIGSQSLLSLFKISPTTFQMPPLELAQRSPAQSIRSSRLAPKTSLHLTLLVNQNNPLHLIIEDLLNLALPILILGELLSTYPSFHPELHINCFILHCLHICFLSSFKDSELPSHETLVNNILNHAITILRNVASFAFAFSGLIQAESSTQSKFLQSVQTHYEDDNLKDVIIDFKLCIQKLLEKKISDNLIHSLEKQLFDIKNESLELKFEVREKYHEKFLKIFNAKAERTPEIVWNQQSRRELHQVIERQLEESEKGGFARVIIEEFEYQVNKESLRIEGVFVKHFNSDIYFKPSNPQEFFNSLMKSLKKSVDVPENQPNEIPEKDIENILEVATAIRNMIKYTNIIGTSAFDFEECISLTCSLLLKTLGEISELRKILRIVLFTILKILIDEDAEYSGGNRVIFNPIFLQLFTCLSLNYILNLDDITKLLSLIFCCIQNQQKQSSPDLTLSLLLQTQGQVLSFMTLLLTPTLPPPVRFDIAFLLKKVPSISSAVSLFMPLELLSASDGETLTKRIDCSEDDTWNKQIKDRAHDMIKQELARLYRVMLEDQAYEWVPPRKEDLLGYKQEEKKVEEDELVVEDINIREFNEKNPDVMPKIGYEEFLVKISQKVNELIQQHLEAGEQTPIIERKIIQGLTAVLQTLGQIKDKRSLEKRNIEDISQEDLDQNQDTFKEFKSYLSLWLTQDFMLSSQPLSYTLLQILYFCISYFPPPLTLQPTQFLSSLIDSKLEQQNSDQLLLTLQILLIFFKRATLDNQSTSLLKEKLQTISLIDNNNQFKALLKQIVSLSGMQQWWDDEESTKNMNNVQADQQDETIQDQEIAEKEVIMLPKKESEAIEE